MPSRVASCATSAMRSCSTIPPDPEPFWNRLEAVRWPDDPDAFDRRLAEILVLFAGLGRQPHIWLVPPHDAPADLCGRLARQRVRGPGPGHT